MIMDIFTVLIVYSAVRTIEDGHEDFAPRFAEGTIEPDDFCMRFKNMPLNTWYNGS